jgi:hypothetical protein
MAAVPEARIRRASMATALLMPVVLLAATTVAPPVIHEPGAAPVEGNVERVRGVPRLVEAASWRRGGSLERTTLGGRPCWWSVTVEEVAAMPRVSDAVAASLVAWRDAGGLPTPESLSGIRGVGDATAGRLASSFRLGCAPRELAWSPGGQRGMPDGAAAPGGAAR